MSEIAVIVSTRIDPVSGRATRSTADANAVMLAKRLHPAPQLLTAGAMAEPVARSYLALGVPSITVLRVASSPADRLAALRDATRDTGLVIAGARGEGGLGSGLLPYMLAQDLGRPLIADVIEVQRDGQGWIVRQALPRGARRRLRLSKPAVLVVSERADCEPVHSWDAGQRGRIERRTVNVSPSPWPRVEWEIETSVRQLRPLAAQTVLSGHARMANATGTAAARKSSSTLRQGSAEDKARALFEHLRAKALIDF